MALTEVNVFGVYVSPWAIVLLIVWGSVFLLRALLTRLSLLRLVWHPALLMFSVFVSVFSMVVLLAINLS